MNINSISAPSGTAINQNPFIVTKTFQSLSKHLQTYDFEKYLDEVTYHILHSNTSMIKDGSVEQFGDWIYTLKFIGNDEKRRKVVNRLREEEIDGFTFMYLTDIEWLNDLKLDRYIFELLSCIRIGWAGVWTDPVDVPEGVPCGVVTGVVADLRAVSVDMARELVAANNDCKSTGAGLFYGQLVVLGYREYRMEGDIFQPVGQSNDKFVLRRRTIPNGLTFVSGARTATATHRIKYTSRVATKDMMLTEEGSGVDTRTVSSQGEFCFAPDPATDVFQVGRLIEPNNDFVVKGPLHYDSSGKQCGPVSRLACRIVCSRLPPFRCFILACGFNADKVYYL